jgi:hypothetical protein
MNLLSIAKNSTLVLVFVSTISAQQHAPTVDVCRADSAVWGNKQAKLAWMSANNAHIRSGAPNGTEIDKLSLTEMTSRSHEMLECMDVDPARANSYDEITTFYSEVIHSREWAFITRHHLMSQFIQEDLAGKR